MVKYQNKMKKLIILKSYLGEIETEEQDYLLYNKIFSEEELEDDYPEIIIQGDSGSWSEESHPMEIDYLIETLESFKSDGANYVEIMYHCDHLTYLLNAVRIRRATEEEMEKDAEELRNLEVLENKERIQKLQEEIQKLENEIQ